MQDEQVLVQGIADLVLVFPDHLELLDYKTDRRRSDFEGGHASRRQKRGQNGGGRGRRDRSGRGGRNKR